MKQVVLVGVLSVALLGAGGKARAKAPKARVQAFWRALASARFGDLSKYYAAKVTLLAGSELLKKRYGLSTRGRRRSVAVPRARLVAAYRRMVGGIGAAKWKRVLSRVGAGRITLMRTPRASARMGARAGDVIAKVATGPGDDVVLFVWRKDTQGTWRVVAEASDW